MRRVLLAVGALFLSASAAWAQSNIPPNLVEAARKARAEQAKKGLQTRVFTNDSLARLGGEISTVGEAGTSAPAAATENTGGEKAMSGEGASTEGAADKKECNDECWRQKFKEQREKIRNTQRELDILQREYNLARTQYYQDPNQAVREQYSNSTAGGRELQKLLESINQKKQEITDLERGLSTLEDDLRRAGGNPGLARE